MHKATTAWMQAVREALGMQLACLYRACGGAAFDSAMFHYLHDYQAWVTELTWAYAPDAEMMSSCKCDSSRKNRAGFENRVTLFVVCLSGWYWWRWDQIHVIQALLFWSHTSSSAWLGLSQVCISVTSYVLWPMETINPWVWDMNWTVHRIRQVSQSSGVDKAKQLYLQK